MALPNGSETAFPLACYLASAARRIQHLTLPASLTRTPAFTRAGRARSLPRPTTVITQQSYGNPFGSAGSWVVNEAGTVQLKLTYQAAPDCQNPRVKLIRWNPAVPLSTPNRVTTVYDQPVALTVQPVILQAGVFATGSGTSSRGVGSTTVPVAFSHLDNGTNAFGFSFSCNRPFRNVMTGGDLLTFISAIPVPPSTFTVGGTVSGLTGTGLVLQNNNSGDLAIAANGAFAFATPLAAGAAYSVTVKTQPTGPTQTCTVGNGAGTATSAVTSVTVTCSVNTSTVGGTVSGLTGTGLALQNNNAGDLAIAANGAFTFPTPVATGAPYSVTVKTQPGGPAQTCTVANGSGTANANVTNVAVSCVVTVLAPKAWQGEAQIEDTGPSQTYGPEIAFDASGNAFAVWAKTDAANTRDDIWANRYTPAGGWQTPQLLESGSGEAIAAHVAVDTNGNAIAVWQQTDATGQHIWANRYSGGAWGAAQRIETDAGSAYSPRIAIDAAGNALVVWSQGDGALSRIRASRFTSGGWGAAETIDGSVGPAYRPQVAVFPGGFAIAVWLQAESGTDHIFYNTFNGTGWSSANVLENNPNGRTGAPQIAADANGNAIAVWSQGDGTGVTSIYSSRFSAGSWGPVELMENSALPNALEPRVAMNAAGNAMAVWIEGIGDQSNAWARLYKTGSGWGVPVLIDSPLGYGARGANVSIDPMGNAIAVWTYLESAYANRYTAGSAWGTPELLEGQVGRADSPNIAMDANGNAIAIWSHTIGGSKTNVWANVFK